jgi:hypothetical protein
LNGDKRLAPQPFRQPQAVLVVAGGVDAFEVDADLRQNRRQFGGKSR